MHTLITHAIAAWKAADLAASDAEGLLRVQFLKYAEGISGPPSAAQIHRTSELRQASHKALAATLDLLKSVDGLRHASEPHPVEE
jgi:hypothetical protein